MPLVGFKPIIYALRRFVALCVDRPWRPSDNEVFPFFSPFPAVLLFSENIVSFQIYAPLLRKWTFSLKFRKNVSVILFNSVVLIQSQINYEESTRTNSLLLAFDRKKKLSQKAVIKMICA